MDSQPLTYEQLRTDNEDLRRRIAEMEQTREARGSGEECCKRLVEDAADIIVQCDRWGRFVYVNPATVRITGYAREELINRNCLDFIKPELREDAEAFYGRQLVQKMKRTCTECPIISKQGDEIWLGLNVQIILEDGTVTGFQAVARDITEARRAREALHTAESRYRTLFENSPDIVYYMNDKGKIISINKVGLELMGLDIEGDMMPGQSLINYIHPEDQDKVVTAFCDAIVARQEISKGLVFRFLKRDGGIVWVELHSRMTYDENGKFLEEVGILRDITERRKMDERLVRLNRELAEANGKLQTAYQWMRDNRDRLQRYRYEEDIGFQVDRNGRIEWASDMALSFSGKSRLALIGGNLPELLLHDGSREEFRQALHRTWRGAPFPFSARVSVNGGTDISMDVKMTRLTSREAKHVWVLFQHPVEKAAVPV